MTYTLNLGRRVARFRALLMALFAISFAACDTADQLTSSTPTEEATVPGAVEPTAAPADLADLTVEDTLGATDPNDPTGGQPIYDTDDDPVEEEDDFAFVPEADAAVGAAPEGMSFLRNYRGGIPFGVTQTPKSLYGRYSGALSNPNPKSLLSFLQAAQRSGTRVMLVFSGKQQNFQSRNRDFNFTMWKAMVNRYRGLNLTPYIKDGTIIGHRMIDEPHDPANWGGRLVSRVQLEAMAKYSKSLWPGMPTIVRSWPAYLRGYRYRYLDAGWAQYAQRFGSVSAFLSKNVRDSKSAGLALVVGLNQIAGVKSGGLRGFYSGKQAFTASQLKSLGSVLLNDSYPCAFLNWKYDARYMGRSDIRSALSYLAGKARTKRFKTCG
jgi:hypothetical protein